MEIRPTSDRCEEMVADHPNKTQILAEGDSCFAIATTKNIIKQINQIAQFNILNFSLSSEKSMAMMTWQQINKIKGSSP